MEISVENALSQLSKTDKPFVEVFDNKKVSVEFYKPEKIDKQKPHDRDEIYVVISGKGTFLNNGHFWKFEPGDLLFVKAGIEHRFVDFSDDFATWVIFF